MFLSNSQIGVVAYTLLCGYEPFYGADNADLLRANKAVEYLFHSPEWDDCNISHSAKDFIASCLLHSADKRLNPEGAKKHPWLNHVFQIHNRAKAMRSKKMEKMEKMEPKALLVLR